MLNRVIILACMLLLAAGPAAAHKIIADAYVEGATIEVEAAFSNGDAAKDARIEVFLPDGSKVHEGILDEDGLVAFTARHRTDHRIVVNAGAGHVVELTITADQLPATLATGSGGSTPFVATAAAAEPTMAAASPAADLEAMIDRAVARQIKPLRQQLAEYEETVRWRDILGGLGFIVGITGIALYVAARRRTGR